jgi:PAS domain S-box-containing protein
MLAAGGEAAALIRSVDWSATPLGPIAEWSSALKTTVAMLLRSRHPMFLWWGPELIQIYNDAYLPSFGIGKHPSAMGQRGRDCWPEIWPVIGPQIDGVMLRGEASWHEDALVPIFRNGAIEDVYWTYGYSPVFDENGTIAGTLVVCTETTGRVLAARRERAMRAEVERERSRLQEFFAQAPAGICIVRGPTLTFEFANAHYRALVGGRDIVGRPLLQALPELQGQGLDAILHGVIGSGEPFIGREVPVTLDRQGVGATEEAFYTFIYSPFRDATSRVDAAIVFALDVTDEVLAKRQTEQLRERLRTSEAQFQVMAESIPQLAWAARPDGHVDWYNQRWYDYTGTTLDTMQGWGWQSVHAPDHIEQVVTRWRASLDSGDAFEMEFPLRGQDGHFRWHLSRAVPLKDENGRITRWFGTNTDIDVSRRAALERKELLEREQAARLAAERASRAKDDFLSTASHELRTPLNAMLGWARLLQSGQLDQSSFIRAIDTIERNARTQVRLIEDILDGSRIINGQLHLETRPLDMTVVVNAALDTVRTAADAKRITLSVTLDPAAARVVGDPDRLQQIIWNLVSNAIKFTPKDGAVTVALDRVGTGIELKVTDNGEGIAPEFLPYVFERFRQAEGSTSRRHSGLGLGLALVRHLVEAHGGTVRAESGGPGRGSAFTVTLPVQAVSAATPGAEPPKQQEASRCVPRAVTLVGARVLVVDDEADARDLVATALRARGAAVTVARSASEALDLVATHPFMVLISDVGMPGTDGYELIGRIRTMTGSRGVHLPAIALTAYSREEDRRRALDAGFTAYASKPIEPDELVQTVFGLLSTAHLHDAETPAALVAGANILSTFEKVLAAQGAHEALQF